MTAVEPTPMATEAAVIAPPKPLSVHAAIAEVMRRLPGIPKGDQAPGNMGGFKYRGIESMTLVLQPVLADVGLVIVPQARSVTVTHSPGQKEAWQDVTIRFDWLLVGPDGTELTATTYGIGRDHTDKGANKAQTQAFKYLLMHLFCVSDDTADGDGHDYTHAVAPEPTPEEAEAERVRRAEESRRKFEVEAVTHRLKKLADERPGDTQTIKGWANDRERKLSPVELADDEWRALVVAKLDEIETEEPF